MFFFHNYKKLMSFSLKEVGLFAINMHINCFRTIVCSRFKCSLISIDGMSQHALLK